MRPKWPVRRSNTLTFLWTDVVPTATLSVTLIINDSPEPEQNCTNVYASMDRLNFTSAYGTNVFLITSGPRTSCTNFLSSPFLSQNPAYIFCRNHIKFDSNHLNCHPEIANCHCILSPLTTICSPEPQPYLLRSIVYCSAVLPTQYVT